MTQETKKFELTSEKMGFPWRILYRIRALKNFGTVKKGQLGGWVEKEENLSQEGNCWISGNAEVSGGAEVSGNAWVSDNARVSDTTWVSDYARVSGTARIFGNARINNGIISE